MISSKNILPLPLDLWNFDLHFLKYYTHFVRSAGVLILSLMLFISTFFNFYLYRNHLEQNRVVEVVDGDTFQLKSGKRVRLLGVDCPEYNRCGGVESRNRLKELINNKVVILKEEHQEAYGRSLALVYFRGNLKTRLSLQASSSPPAVLNNHYLSV